MSIYDFMIINCRACGKLIWEGHSSGGVRTKLDTRRLTIVEEIVKKVNAIQTFEAHRTSVSFEATARIGARVIGSKPNPEKVILAEHRCESFSLFETEVPDYWGRYKKPILEPEEIPF
jgi:hypothetical protein